MLGDGDGGGSTRTEPTETVETCPCGIAGRQPWAGRDRPWSAASGICGVLVLGLGVVAIEAGFRPWIGAVVGAVYVACTVLAFVVVARAGHRGSCLVRRGFWIGLAALGLPLRAVLGLGLGF